MCTWLLEYSFSNGFGFLLLSLVEEEGVLFLLSFDFELVLDDEERDPYLE